MAWDLLLLAIEHSSGTDRPAVSPKTAHGESGSPTGIKDQVMRDLFTRLSQVMHDFLAGAALSWIAPPYVIRRRTEMERVFALMLNAELLGLPLLPPHYLLRFLPYEIPILLSWRRMTSFDRELQWADLRHLGH